MSINPPSTQDEIKAYHETDKHMRLRSRLYQSCGVVLDDLGQVASDKAVQVHVTEDGKNLIYARSEELYICILK